MFKGNYKYGKKHLAKFINASDTVKKQYLQDTMSRFHNKLAIEEYEQGSYNTNTLATYKKALLFFLEANLEKTAQQVILKALQYYTK